ncbi:MAG TPA: hypothetical protein VEY10_18520 [Flavisolibacter sp.]|nr:hypothetical protein [Flavisolibacter sp.]
MIAITKNKDGAAFSYVIMPTALSFAVTVSRCMMRIANSRPVATLTRKRQV